MKYDAANEGTPYRGIREKENCVECGGELRYYSKTEDPTIHLGKCVADQCNAPHQPVPALFNTSLGKATEGLPNSGS